MQDWLPRLGLKFGRRRLDFWAFRVQVGQSMVVIGQPERFSQAIAEASYVEMLRFKLD
jgi:hypothetical protein